MTEETLFAAALETPDPAERAALLDRACAGDAPLRRRVEALLASHHRPDFLGTPAIERAALALGGRPPAADAAAPPPDDPPPDDRPGVVLAGRYKLVEEIGEGGMGTVWMARQTEPVRRAVAVKLIKPGMDSKQVLARFEAERQALALMDHPNIAKVLDAGTAADGRPFFVLELVKGVPITRYCDEHRLTPRQRLELFVPVCHAIQHAHQKGIIHRDLKPSNVLVARYDDQPVPKIIDFGVAKAVGLRLTEQTLQTGFWSVVGTLEYMSPEQAGFNQLDVDTCSDVYSLAVLLYELLTGTTPLEHWRAKDAGMLEALRIIREEEAPTLSQRLSTTKELPAIAARRAEEPAKLTRLVSGELDWVVMKALDKDRNRRYETATALAADLRSYLADGPVLACPPSAAYRFRKFGRRNRVALMTAGLVALALIAGIVVSTWQAVRARRAESEARQEAAIAEAVNEFLNEGLLAQADPRRTPDRDLKLRTVLDRASQRIEGRFADQPLVEARLRRTLATTYESLGEYQVAERHAERARDLYRGALGAEHPDTLAATNGLAQILWWQWRYDEARELHEETLSLRRRVLGAEHPETLKSMYSLANVLWEQGRLEDAYRLHQETLDIRRRVLTAEHPDTLLSMSGLASVLYYQERYDEARKLHEEVVSLQRRVLGVEHPDTLRSMHYLANDLDCLGKFEEARKLNQETLDIRRRVLTAGHPDTLRSMNNLAWVLANAPDSNVRNPARAVELAREVVQKAPEKRFGWNTLGAAYYRAGDWNNAIAAMERSMDPRYGGGIAHDYFFVAMAHWQLGQAGKTEEDRHRHRQEARKWYDEALAWMKTNLPRNEELMRFRAEAADLMGIREPSDSPMK